MADKASLASTESQVKVSRARRQWNACSMRTKGMTVLTVVMMVLFAITLPLLLYRNSSRETVKMKSQLVVIMISGMRWDYVELLPQYDLGGFNNFRNDGVRVEYVDTVFPSLKMPAWTTLQTGLYPEEHNVLGNRMLDESSGLMFDWRDEGVSKMPVWWQYAEPIWITLSNRGLRVATLEWSSADVPYQNQLPEVAKGYTRSKLPFRDRIEEVKLRIRQDYDLTMMYYEGVDEKAHKYGPASDEVMIEINKMGRELDELFDFITTQGRQNMTNVLIVSDRGHAHSCDVNPVEDLTSLFEEQSTEEVVVQDGAMYLVYTYPHKEEKILALLKDVSGYEVYRSKDLPAEYHFKHGKYAPSIVIFAVPRESPNTTEVPTNILKGKAMGQEECTSQGGVCGLDPRRAPSMRTILLGWGPAFIGGGLVHPPLHLVDVYQLFFHALGQLPPERTEGRWNAVRGLLRSSECPERKIEKFTANETASSDSVTIKSTEETTPILEDESTNEVKRRCSFDLNKYLRGRDEFTKQWETHFNELRKLRQRI